MFLTTPNLTLCALVVTYGKMLKSIVFFLIIGSPLLHSQASTCGSLFIPWSPVQKELESAIRNGEISNQVTVEIYNSNHQKLFSFQPEVRDRHQDIPVLSASKWVSAAVILRLADQGFLSIDTPISEYAKKPDGTDFEGPWKAVTLKHLLSFTSGIEQRKQDGAHVGSESYQNPKISFEESVQIVIDEAPKKFTPGEKFIYGNNHLVIAAWAAVQATGKNWNTLFKETIADPLGFTSEARYYAKPRTQKGIDNPGLGHGLRVSLDDYIKFVQMMFEKGFSPQNKKRILSAEAISAIENVHWKKDIEVGFSPADLAEVNAKYGLGAWIECTVGCLQPTISSVGLAGFYPWIDRENNYYAVISGYNADSSILAWKPTWKLAQRIKPFIEQAIKTETKN